MTSQRRELFLPEPAEEIASLAREWHDQHCSHCWHLTRASKELAEAFNGELIGVPSPAKAMQIRRAAELAAIAEHARTQRLAGDTSLSLDDLVRVDSAARRAIRDLELPSPDAKPSNAATAGLDYLREKYGPSTDEAAR